MLFILLLILLIALYYTAPKLIEFLASRSISKYFPCSVTVQNFGFFSAQGVLLNFFNGDMLFIDNVHFKSNLWNPHVASVCSLLINRVDYHTTQTGLHTFSYAMTGRRRESLNCRLRHSSEKGILFKVIQFLSVTVKVFHAELVPAQFVHHTRHTHCLTESRLFLNPSSNYVKNDESLLVSVTLRTVSLTFETENDYLFIQLRGGHVCAKLFANDRHLNGGTTQQSTTDHGYLVAHLSMQFELTLGLDTKHLANTDSHSPLSYIRSQPAVNSVCLNLIGFRVALLEEFIGVFERFKRTNCYRTSNWTPDYPALYEQQMETDHQIPSHVCISFQPHPEQMAYPEDGPTDTEAVEAVAVGLHFRLIRSSMKQSIRLTATTLSGHFDFTSNSGLDTNLPCPSSTSTPRRKLSFVIDSLKHAAAHRLPTLVHNLVAFRRLAENGRRRLSHPPIASLITPGCLIEFNLSHLHCTNGWYMEQSCHAFTCKVDLLNFTWQVTQTMRAIDLTLTTIQMSYVNSPFEVNFIRRMVDLMRPDTAHSCNRSNSFSPISCEAQSADVSFSETEFMSLLPIIERISRLFPGSLASRLHLRLRPSHRSPCPKDDAPPKYYSSDPGQEKSGNSMELTPFAILFFPNPGASGMQLGLSSLDLKLNYRNVSESHWISSLVHTDLTFDVTGLHLSFIPSLPKPKNHAEQFEKLCCIDSDVQFFSTLSSHLPVDGAHRWGHWFNLLNLSVNFRNNQLDYDIEEIQCELNLSDLKQTCEWLVPFLVQSDPVVDSYRSVSSYPGDGTTSSHLLSKPVTFSGRLERLHIIFLHSNRAMCLVHSELFELSAKIQNPTGRSTMSPSFSFNMNGTVHPVGLFHEVHPTVPINGTLYQLGSPRCRQLSAVEHVRLPDLKWEADWSQRLIQFDCRQSIELLWTPAVHLLIYEVLSTVIGSIARISFRHLLIPLKHSSVFSSLMPQQNAQSPDNPWTFQFSSPSTVQLIVQLATGLHRLTFCLRHVALRLLFLSTTHAPPQSSSIIPRSQLKLSLTEAVIRCDEENIFLFKQLNVRYRPASGHHRTDYEKFVWFTKANSAWEWTADLFYITFPYRYLFRAIYSEGVTLLKFVKSLTSASGVSQVQPSVSLCVEEGAFSEFPSDSIFCFRRFVMEIKDDPFESRLNDIFLVSSAEQTMHEQRVEALLQTPGLKLTEKEREACFTRLEEQRANEYRKHMLQFKHEFPVTDELFTWTLDNLRLKSLADPTLSSRDQVVRRIRELDSESPWPNLTSADFSTLWCRMISLNVDSWRFQLRDYPKPWLEMTDLFVWGQFAAADRCADWTGQYDVQVVPDNPWPEYTVVRNGWPVKFYYDFTADVRSLHLYYGSNWSPTIAWLSQRLEDIASKSVDSSTPRLGWWDVIRHKLHGRFYLVTEQMHWLYSASWNPYNDTEFFTWQWSTCTLLWTSGHFHLSGTLDILYRTASKYDRVCHLFHLPNLDIDVDFDWLSYGDPLDHHAVHPCNFERLDAALQKTHDSYFNFRGNRLSVRINCSCSADSEQQPRCWFYTSVLKFSDRMKMCLTRVPRPIRRGRIFSYQPYPKPILGRILQFVDFRLQLPNVESTYWVSYANRTGVHMTTGPISLTAELQRRIAGEKPLILERLHKNNDGGHVILMQPPPLFVPRPSEPGTLIRRPSATWSVIRLFSSLRNSRIQLRHYADLPGQVVQMLLQYTSVDAQQTEDKINASITHPAEDFIMVPFLQYEQVSPQPIRPGQLMARVYIPGREIQVNPTSTAESSKSTPTGDILTHDSLTPTHKLIVIDLKFRWTEHNRNLIYTLIDSYQHAKLLKRNLSSSATHPLSLPNTGRLRTSSSNFNALHSSVTSGLFSHTSGEQSAPDPIPKSYPTQTVSDEKTPSTTVALSQVGSSSEEASNRSSPATVSTGVGTNPIYDQVPMLAQLVEEVGKNQWHAYCEEEPQRTDVAEQLLGLTICSQSPVVARNWCVELLNSQLLLKTNELTGYVLVAASRAKLDALAHPPIWKGTELLNKSSLVGHLECMQYYATVGQLDPFQPDQWLHTSDLTDLGSNADVETEALAGCPEVVGSGRSVGGLVSACIIDQSASIAPSKSPIESIQLQRMIPRCSCQVFCVNYETADPSNIPFPHLIPPLPLDETDVVRTQEGADTVTLLHHTLQICTNSQQYHMIGNIVNDLLLYMEPQRKAQSERNRLALGLMTASQVHSAIRRDQEALRQLVAEQRRLERYLWSSVRQTMVAMNLNPIDGNNSAAVNRGLPEQQISPDLNLLIKHARLLETRINTLKTWIVDQNTLLSQRLAHYQQLQIQAQRQHMRAAMKSSLTHPSNPNLPFSSSSSSLLQYYRDDRPSRSPKPMISNASVSYTNIEESLVNVMSSNDANTTSQPGSNTATSLSGVVRRSEVCFEHATWMLTENDGQIELADVELRGFLYCKIHRQDGSGSHWLELGWIRVRSRAPNSFFKVVLVPDLVGGHYGGGPIVRISCSELPPVGGLSVKEAIEISVAPMVLQVSKKFYQTLMPFFFPEKPEMPLNRSGVAPTPLPVLEHSDYRNPTLLNDTTEISEISSSSRSWSRLRLYPNLIRLLKRDESVCSNNNSGAQTLQDSPNLTVAAAMAGTTSCFVSDTSAHVKTNYGRPKTANPTIVHSSPTHSSPNPLPIQSGLPVLPFASHTLFTLPDPDFLSWEEGLVDTSIPNTGISVSGSHANPVDVMRERARQNNVFLYIKIPGFPICLSYKGEKQKNITDVTRFQLTMPTMEYHNCVWTWLDFAMEVKSRIRKQLIREVIRKKFTPRRGLSFKTLFPRNSAPGSTIKEIEPKTVDKTDNQQPRSIDEAIEKDERSRKEVMLLGPHAQLYQTTPASNKWRRTRMG